MQALSAFIVSAMALSAMAAPTATATGASAPAATGIPAISPGSTVQFQLYNTDVCIGAPDATSTVGANMLLAACGSERTVFELPTGAPTDPTQLAFGPSRSGANGPITCVNARNVAVNQAVFLDVCEDDAYERWRVIGGSGIGPVISTGTGAKNGTYCLSAISSTEGSPVVFGSCTGGLTQQWSTTVLSTN
ncbi:unnamed protein product [Peniophora sp. CBMAI 1063]|nr:unnamed protein product [Peniophora sp. CBMAI 1063]